MHSRPDPAVTPVDNSVGAGAVAVLTELIKEYALPVEGGAVLVPVVVSNSVPPPVVVSIRESARKSVD